MTEAVAVAVLAKAPLPGFAKTRLIPALGAEGAALLQARLVEHAIATASGARIGPVTLWAAPDESHPLFQTIAARGVALARQNRGDLGARMLAAVAATATPTIAIGTDCPALTPDHLRTAADILRRGTDAVIIPAEDGGYVLIGLRAPAQALFSDMPWSTPTVMKETRRRLRDLRLTWREPVILWDLDLPEDLERLRASGLHHLIPSQESQTSGTQL